MIPDDQLRFLKNNIYFTNKLNANVGIVTAADSNVFDGLQILFTSINNKQNFLCYDLGLTEDQKQWCYINGLSLKLFPHLERERLSVIPNWQTYCKPWIIEASGFDYVLWIDTDCIIVGDILASPYILNKQTFFTRHWINHNHIVQNNHKVYEKFPVPVFHKEYINAGVIGANLKDNQTLNILKDWKRIIETCIQENVSFLDNFSAWDEGVLLWAIEHNEALDNITSDSRYNHFSAIGSSPFERISLYEAAVFAPSALSYLFFKQLNKHKDKYILHFSSCMKNKNKFWKMWPSK